MPEKIIARDHDHLVQLIEEAIEEKGPKCDLNFIDVSQVTDMHAVFAESKFNGDISQWNVSNVTCMNRMFAGSSFDGDISHWDVSNVVEMEDMFYGSALETSGKIPAWYKESCF